MDNTNHTDLKNKNIYRALILVLGFLFSTKLFALNITILDTGFCPEQIIKNKNVTILSPVDLTNSIKLDCTKPIDPRDKRFHGQQVIQTFVNNLAPNISVNIRPYIIFDDDKMQLPIYWKRAFSNEIQALTDVYLIAAGLPFLDANKELNQLKDIKISKLVFVAGGTTTLQISKDHKLWPQELRLNLDIPKKIYIIGEYYPKTKYDTAYLDKRIKYKNSTDFFFPYTDGENKNIFFNGSSYSVAFGLAKILSACDELTLEKDLATKKCGKIILLDKNLSF